MPRGKPLSYPGHNAIDMQRGTNWYIIPSDEQSRELVRKVQRSKISAEKICWFCGQKFDYGYASMHVCDADKIIVSCNVCGKKFQLDLSRYSGTDAAKINEALFNGENIVAFCSKKCKCKAQGKSYSQWCKEHPDELRESFKSRYDDETGHYFRGNDDLTLKAALMRTAMKKIEDADPIKRKKHRLKCIKSAQQWCKEHPEEAYKIAIQNLGKYAGAKFVEKDCTLFYWNAVTDESIPWEEFKKNFIIYSAGELPNGFQFVPTFREQDSIDWSGAKVAFEQNLVDMNIGWFVYVKFYIDKNGDIKPLVIGKSGSLLVNMYGSDLSFSIDVNDGQSRRFLAEGGFQWCKTQIAILPVGSENEAYEKELEHGNAMNLFHS